MSQAKQGNLKVVRVIQNFKITSDHLVSDNTTRRVKKGLIGLVYRYNGKTWIAFEDGGDDPYPWSPDVETNCQILFEGIGSAIDPETGDLDTFSRIFTIVGGRL